MKKESFMNELRYELGNMDAHQKDDILSEFDEHFTLAKKEGKTEEDICISLGDPSAIASQFFSDGAEYVIPGDEPPHTGNSEYPNTGTIHNGEPSRLNGVIPSESSQRKTYTNIKKQYSTADVTLIDIDVKHAEISICPANSNGIDVTIEGRAPESNYHIKCENGCLSIVEDKLATGFFLLGFLKRLNQDIRIKVTFPENFKSSVNVRNGAGNTDISGARGILLKVKNSAGNVRINDCAYNDMDIKSSAGNLLVQGCTSESFDLKTTAGNIDALRCSGSMKAHSSAGNIKVEGYTGETLLKSSAGDIRIMDSDGDISAHTAAGNVTVESRRSTGSVIANSTAGNVHVESGEITKLEAESSAGSTKVSASRICEGRLNAMAGEAVLIVESITGHVIVKASLGKAEAALPMDTVVKIIAKASMGGSRVEIPSDPTASAMLEVYSSMGEAIVRAI